MAELQIVPRKLLKDNILISLGGTIDTLSAPDLERTIKGFMDDSIYRFIFDLTDLDHITSSGAGVFINLLHAIRSAHLSYKAVIIFINPQPAVLEIFNLLGIARYINIVPDRPAALKIVGKLHNGEQVQGLKACY